MKRLLTFLLGSPLFLVCGLTIAASAARLAVSWDDTTHTGWLVLAAFGIVIALGEAVPLHTGEGRWSTPLALTATLALALVTWLPGEDLRQVTTAHVVILVLVATTVGSLARLLVNGHGFNPHRLAARLLVTTVVAVGYRLIPFWSETLLELNARRAFSPVLTALLLAAVVLSALVMEAVLSPWYGDTTFLDWNAGLRDFVRHRGPITASIGVGAVTIVVTMESLHVVALIVYLVPLGLLQLAMLRNIHLRETNIATVQALSALTEVGGHTDPGHPRRVARLAVAMGRELCLGEEELRDLRLAALLHDIGQASLRLPLPHGATVEAAPMDQLAIAETSARILQDAGSLARLGPVLTAQASRYVEIHERGRTIPLAARIIKLANAYDDFTQGRRGSVVHEHAVERISLGLGYEYDPELAQILFSLTAARAAHGSGASTSRTSLGL